MSVSLENLFSTRGTIQNSQTGSSMQPVNSAVQNVLQNIFSTGDVISGKIIGLQGQSVELLLPNGQNITALLGQNVQVNMGEQMIFAIKSMNANQVELNPLFTNTANTSTIMKALEGANMPVNEQNVTMVQNMMERGMSIQKDALLSMKRSIAQFPNAPATDVVTLHALKMSVNETNLTQLAAYKNSENQIMRPIMEMFSEIPNTFEQLINSGETTKAVLLYKDLVQLFSQISSEGEIVNQGKNVLQGDVANQSTNVIDLVKEGTVNTKDALLNVNTPQYATEFTNQIKYLLQKFGVENGQIEAILRGNPTKQDVMQILQNQIVSNSAMTEDVLTEIFKDPIFQKFMNDTGREVSTLAPREVANYDNIENLYEHLQKRADKILETLAGKEDFALAKSAENLKANVDFMNQMNQMFQYVQLPLKFTEGHANGELYVYGNGKKLSLEDGNVSALLHLDMEHLGTVDIHVEMNSEKQVKTNFYFEDEAMLDFVYEHIDMLNERLEMRGYGPITNVQMRDSSTSTPVSEMFEKKEETPILLKTQSFDARI